MDEAAWPARMKAVTEWKRLDDGGLTALEQWCASVPEPTLILIDTLKRVRPPRSKTETDYEADYRSAEGLQSLASRIPGLSILVSHHDRKLDADDPFDTVSGTLGLTASVDTIAILKRKGSGDGAPVTLHIEGRDLEEEIAKAVRFDRETCRWTILGEASEVQRSAERSRILGALRHAPEGLSVGEIVARASLTNRHACDCMLGRMLEDGAVERIKHGRYGMPGTKARMQEEAAKRAKEKRQTSRSLATENAARDHLSPLNGKGKPERSLYLSDFTADASDDEKGEHGEPL
jgi:hypothetical protein